MGTRPSMVRAVLIALPSLVAAVVVAVVAGAVSPGIKNLLAALGFAIPARFQQTGITVGSDPAVMIGGWAYLTWLGAGVVLVAIIYVVLALQRPKTAVDELEHLNAPPPPTGQGAGQMQGQTMSPQMPVQQMPMQQMPYQQMPGQYPGQFPQ